MQFFDEEPETPPPTPAIGIDAAFELVYDNNFNEPLARRWVHESYLENAAYTRATHSHRNLWDESYAWEFGPYNPDCHVEIFEPGTPEPEGGKEPVLRQRSSQRKRAVYKAAVDKAAKRKRGGY